VKGSPQDLVSLLDFIKEQISDLADSQELPVLKDDGPKIYKLI
jgi:hypothetical protein